MKTYAMGFIGAGNMASAIVEGAAKAGFWKEREAFLYDVLPEAARRTAEATGTEALADLNALVEKSDMLLLGVKPDKVEQVLASLAADLSGKAILSIAAKWPFAKLKPLVKGARLLCVMPSTPARVGEGITLFETGSDFTAEEMAFAKELFESMGMVEEMTADHMRIAGTVTSCGPAFAYMMLEGLADGAVKLGLPRAVSYRLASQMLVGAGKLQLETGLHPGILKDNVCSPGGLTIKGVAALEQAGLRAAMIDAVDKATPQ